MKAELRAPMSGSYKPEGYHSVTRSLTVRDGSAALAFYQSAFGAMELFRLADPSGKVMHAEFQIGDSKMMISDEFPDWDSFAPEIAKGALYMIYVPDADAAFTKAVDCGATPLDLALEGCIFPYDPTLRPRRRIEVFHGSGGGRCPSGRRFHRLPCRWSPEQCGLRGGVQRTTPRPDSGPVEPGPHLRYVQ